jgi:two-component sensor histidine kinase
MIGFQSAATFGASMDIADPFARVEDGHALARAIVDTIREPLLVLDKDLRVIAASRSFYVTFKMSRGDVQGHLVYMLGEGQWNIPQLRLLLETILPQHAVMEAYERETKELLQQKEVLLQEMQHRVANSLQIIASILLLKARTVRSEETRLHLHDAHQRVMSVAAVQQQLQASRHGESIELGPYLSRLCESLAASMIGGTRPISLKVDAASGTASTGDAISLGLIVTELVINALKHAFLHDRSDGRIIVSYEASAAGWRLAVSDNGNGKAPGGSKRGLGTSIVEALGRQLGAQVEVASGPQGTRVSIVHAAIASKLTHAA